MTKTGLLILATIFATGALAQPREVQPPAQSERVAYTDLDLGSRGGQAALRHRIEVAAGRVCDTGGMLSMEDFVVTAQCYRLAYEDGNRQVDRVIAANRTGAALAASAIVVSAK